MGITSDLKEFIELVESQPELLHSPDLAFFKKYLTSLGATVPEVEALAKTETTMDEPSLTKLKVFIELVESYPQLLHSPELAFFKKYLESKGATIPKQTWRDWVNPSAWWGTAKKKWEAYWEEIPTVAKLKTWVAILKDNPKKLDSPELAFFKEYLESMDATIPKATKLNPGHPICDAEHDAHAEH